MRTLALLFSLAVYTAVCGQGTQADYDRAFGCYWKYEGKLFRDKVQPVWIPDGLWYKVQTDRKKYEYVLVDAKSGKSEPLFDAGKLTAALTEIGASKFSMDDVPPARIELSADRATLRFPVKDDLITYDRKDHSVAIGKPAKVEEKKNPRPRREPNPWRASGGIGLLITDSETEIRVSLAASGKDYQWSGPFLFSPDRKKLIAFRVYPGERRDVTMVESSPKSQLQPKVRTNANYAKPGDRIEVLKPVLFDIETAKEVVLQEKKKLSEGLLLNITPPGGGKEFPFDDKLFANPFDIRNYRWEPDSSRFTFEYNQRGHQVYRVLSIDAKTGAVAAIVDEQAKTFFEYSGKHFLHWRSDRPELFWMSERSGWNHIYRIDVKTGKVINPVTQGDWVVRGVEYVDEAKEQITLRVGGIDPKQDPYYVQYIRVNFDGSNLVRLTEGDGTHKAAFSPDRKLLIDTYSRSDMPPVVELRNGETGKKIADLERADDAALRKLGWKPPERFAAKGRDGKTDIYGLIYRPENFDPAKRYPVIEHIYAGPQDSYVPKGFQVNNRVREYAELGFIVVQIDGMGTSNRSKAFHDVCWKNLGDAGFPDRIAWMKAAAEKHPEIDLTRVGIYGGSAGGQNALRALIDHGEFYKAAAADCGCHDNRMDKIWWNELWMGYPVGREYEESSNVVQAHKMRGKLLLTVGELDRNVDPASTMQVANALIKANKDFELIVFPGADHGAGDSPYGNRRRMDFFVRNLMGVEPRAK